MPFQSQVNVQPAAFFPGDFTSSNPRFHTNAGPFGLVAGPAGLTVARFAWFIPAPLDPDGTPQQVSNSGYGPVAGFVTRRQQGLNFNYMQEYSMFIPPGFMVELLSGGDIAVRNDGLTQARMGQTAYANFADGKITFGPAQSAGASAGTITSMTSTFTGSIADDVLSVSAGTNVQPGAVLTGGNIAPGTQIISQVNGTANGPGNYLLNYGEQGVLSSLMTQTYGLFTAAGTITGTFAEGDVLSGPGGGNAVTPGTVIYGPGPNQNTYICSPPTGGNVTASVIEAQTNVATKWIAMGGGLPGETVKISDHALG